MLSLESILLRITKFRLYTLSSGTIQYICKKLVPFVPMFSPYLELDSVYILVPYHELLVPVVYYFSN